MFTLTCLYIWHRLTASCQKEIYLAKVIAEANQRKEAKQKVVRKTG